MEWIYCPGKQNFCVPMLYRGVLDSGLWTGNDPSSSNSSKTAQQQLHRAGPQVESLAERQHLLPLS